MPPGSWFRNRARRPRRRSRIGDARRRSPGWPASLLAVGQPGRHHRASRRGLGSRARHRAGRRPLRRADPAGRRCHDPGGRGLRHRPAPHRRGEPTRGWPARSCWCSPAGCRLAILTGDLFTLFVAFELILVSSYVLLTHQGRRAQIRSGMTYVVMNLFASTLFLFGLAYRLRRHRHGQPGPARRADPRPRRRRSPRHRPVVPGRVRHQGRDLPAVLLAARQLSDRSDHDHGGLRRAAHQDRRLRRSSASTPSPGWTTSVR